MKMPVSSSRVELVSSSLYETVNRVVSGLSISPNVTNPKLHRDGSSESLPSLICTSGNNACDGSASRVPAISAPKHCCPAMPQNQMHKATHLFSEHKAPARVIHDNYTTVITKLGIFLSSSHNPAVQCSMHIFNAILQLPGRTSGPLTVI